MRIRGNAEELWFAEKFVSLLIEQHHVEHIVASCYVVICWKIRIFAYWTTPGVAGGALRQPLWFAEKFVSLLIEQHQPPKRTRTPLVVICWKIRIFAYWTTPTAGELWEGVLLWFAEKFVSLLIEQHLDYDINAMVAWLWFAEKFVSLLIEQHREVYAPRGLQVVICWKIRIFAYWTTPRSIFMRGCIPLWFAEKFVSLLIEQHLFFAQFKATSGCDLLKNSYLCLLNNTCRSPPRRWCGVVICWKIRIFAYWTTPYPRLALLHALLWFAEKFVSLLIEQHPRRHIFVNEYCCDLLKNSYLCLLNNTSASVPTSNCLVVICWKIRIFAYWTTPANVADNVTPKLWFAEKFVSLLIEQHQMKVSEICLASCDLLKNSYLCLLNNTFSYFFFLKLNVVICWKIRIFAYWTTPRNEFLNIVRQLWFAEKFVSLLIEQHHADSQHQRQDCCDLLKNSYLCLLNNTNVTKRTSTLLLWFAEKFVSLLIEQHPPRVMLRLIDVVICWKIRIFAYWTTPKTNQWDKQE